MDSPRFTRDCHGIERFTLGGSRIATCKLQWNAVRAAWPCLRNPCARRARIGECHPFGWQALEEQRKCCKFRRRGISTRPVWHATCSTVPRVLSFMESVAVQRAERVAVDFPMPSRNFAATRRMLLIVLAVSIVFPLVCLGGYGYFDYQRRIADSNDVIDRLVRVAQEKAGKGADPQQAMGAPLREVVGTPKDAQV